MKQFNNLTILAIETSCDDTCVAALKVSGKKRPCFEVLANIVSSQTEIHKKWGGVYPSLAKREHQKNLPLVLEEALKKSGKPKIDLIAVTVGPGLEPCLWTGINFAKKLSKEWNLPIIPVNHIEAHILVNFAGENSKKVFPTVCLVISGGHTQMILMKDFGKYKTLGETRDDAAGECFDKVARILGLGYPGGPAIAEKASKTTETRVSVNLPRPMLNQKNYEFSFSGLKTAVLYNHKKYGKEEMAKETQQAIIDVLIKKTIKAAKDYRVKTIILGGGVAANEELRKQFKEKFNNLLIPPKNLCTDNALMTGIAGYFHRKEKTKNWKKIKADANLRIS